MRLEDIINCVDKTIDKFIELNEKMNIFNTKINKKTLFERIYISPIFKKPFGKYYPDFDIIVLPRDLKNRLVIHECYHLAFYLDILQHKDKLKLQDKFYDKFAKIIEDRKIDSNDEFRYILVITNFPKVAPYWFVLDKHSLDYILKTRSYVVPLNFKVEDLKKEKKNEDIIEILDVTKPFANRLIEFYDYLCVVYDRIHNISKLEDKPLIPNIESVQILVEYGLIRLNEEDKAILEYIKEKDAISREKAYISNYNLDEIGANFLTIYLIDKETFKDKKKLYNELINRVLASYYPMRRKIEYVFDAVKYIVNKFFDLRSKGYSVEEALGECIRPKNIVSIKERIISKI